MRSLWCLSRVRGAIRSGKFTTLNAATMITIEYEIENDHSALLVIPVRNSHFFLMWNVAESSCVLSLYFTHQIPSRFFLVSDSENRFEYLNFQHFPGNFQGHGSAEFQKNSKKNWFLRDSEKTWYCWLVTNQMKTLPMNVFSYTPSSMRMRNSYLNHRYFHH